MFRPDTLAHTALLAFLTSFGPLSVDLFLPSMPQIGETLRASPGAVQLTISLYLAGYAVGQIVYGPLSDRFGRRPVLLVSYVSFCAATMVCTLAPTIEVLIAARVAQALGVSGSLVVVRAIVRDLYEGALAGQKLSMMSMMMGFMPIVAPLIGGALLTAFGWRAGFLFQCAIGALAGILVWRFIPETHAPARIAVPAIVANYRLIAGSPMFLANLAIGSLAYSGLFAWIAGSSFVIQDITGLTPMQYAYCYAASCVGFMLGGMIATRLVMRLGLDRTAGVGAAALALAGTGMIAATAAAGVLLPLALTVSMGFYLCGLGLLLSQTVAAAMMPFPRQAGTASSLIGFAQQCAGAIMGALMSRTLETTAWPMTIGVAIAGGGALMLWLATRRLRLATQASKPETA